MRKAPKVVVPALALVISVVTLVVLFNKMGSPALQGGGGGGGAGDVVHHLLTCFFIAFVLTLIVFILLLICALVCAIIDKDRETCGQVCILTFIVLMFLVVTFFLSCLLGAI